MNTGDTIGSYKSPSFGVTFILLGKASVVGRWHFAVRADCTALYGER